MNKIRLLIADDHPVFLKGLRMLLSMKEKETGLQIICAVSNGAEAVRKIRETHIDVALLDIKMPGMDGIDAAIEIKEICPQTKIIMLTTFDDSELIYKALQVGVHGYLLKDAPVEKIVDAVKTVHKGDVLIGSHAAKMLRRPEAEQRNYKGLSCAQKKINMLSPREQEVFLLIALGKGNQEIADDLFISERTVRNYASRVYEIIGVHKRGQLIIWAKEQGLV